MKLFTILVLLLSTLVHAGDDYKRWIRTQRDVKFGQALVVHGLNTEPEKMGHLVSELNQRGHDVLLLKLFGHNADLERMKTVTADEWKEQFREAYAEVLSANRRNGGKLTFVGFSLGGLLGMEFISQNTNHEIDQAILFAPALKIRTTSYLVNAARVLGDGVVIPSMSPEAYRAQEGTTVAAYRALFDTVGSFKSGDLAAINIPTVVFIDKNDELVSYGKLKRLVEGLDRWELITVDNKDSTLRPKYNHLIIDPVALGAREWNEKVVPGLDKILKP